MEVSGLGRWQGAVWLNESKQYVARFNKVEAAA